ncbi:MAG: transcription termination factor Rho [Lachnospiraceae bacterium]|nr:transcription termination factor Rho [Lachnospiraceae bacterium]
MREKLQSLPLSQLRELGKAGGLSGVTTMKKADLIEALVQLDLQNRQEAARAQEAQKSEEKPAAEKKPAGERAAQSRDAAPRRGRTVKPESGSEADGPGKTPAPAKSAEPRKAAAPARSAETERTPEPVRSAAPARPATPERQSAPERPERTEAPAEGAPEATAKRTGLEEVYVPQEGAEEAYGILEVLQEGYGFIRSDNYLPGDNDVYVSPAQIRHFGLRTGDILRGMKKAKSQTEKFSPLIFLGEINGRTVKEAMKRTPFENLTPIFPNKRIRLETPGCSVAMRVMDLISPVGKGQRGMIVSPPKAGKTTLLKEVASSILKTDPQMHILILLIDERPEEVTDIREAIIGENVECIYSTFDETPEHHMRVSEMVIERARRLVEHKEDVVILLDSITRLARAYNQVIPPSGRTLSGGLDPAALHMPKRFFGAARNMREGGSLTILATALVETGSKMDDVVYEEFKGTGNMEIILDRKLQEKRIFPAVDLAKSSTRREDLLLSREELEAIGFMRKSLNGLKSEEATDRILDMFAKTRSNADFVALVRKNKFF